MCGGEAWLTCKGQRTLWPRSRTSSSLLSGASTVYFFFKAGSKFCPINPLPPVRRIFFMLKPIHFSSSDHLLNFPTHLTDFVLCNVRAARQVDDPPAVLLRLLYTVRHVLPVRLLLMDQPPDRPRLDPSLLQLMDVPVQIGRASCRERV